MKGVLADTHAANWFLRDDPRLSVNARQALDAVVNASGRILVSAISVVEIVYLVEKGRLPAELYNEFDEDLLNPQGTFELVAVNSAVARALAEIPYATVGDMPDRIVAATALVLGCPLVTADRQLRRSPVETIW